MDGNGRTSKTADTDQVDRHQEVALRAYRLWEERGSPVGSPEEDWFRAEQEISGTHAELERAA